MDKKQITEYLIILILVFVGFVLRYHNLLLEDYWADEMIGFAQADPNLTFKETLRLIHNPEFWDKSDQTPILFHLLLKYFYKFFGYNPDYGRIFTLLLGISVIPLALLVIRELNAKKGSLLFCFLLCTNIYLINYSQEVRPYILLFLLSFVSIYFFLKILNNLLNKNNFYFSSLVLILINVLGFLTHPFFLIIVASEILYCFIIMVYLRKEFFKVLTILIFSFIFSLLIQYEYIISLINLPDFWIENPSIKFITDFYFSRFFGSKIMGTIYLLVTLLLFLTFRKKIFSLNNYYLFLIIIIFLSYILPFIYGFIRMPVLHDRYIIFILIPILALISILIYELKNLKLRKIIISTLVIINISHLYYEMSNKVFYKPEVSKILISINEASQQEYSKNIFIDEEKNPPYFSNYVIRLNNFLINDFLLLKEKETLYEKSFWLICYIEDQGLDCPKSNIEEKFETKKILKTKKIIAKYKEIIEN